MKKQNAIFFPQCLLWSTETDLGNGNGKNQQQKQSKNRTRHLLRLLFLICIKSNCIATRVNVDNCTFKATVQPYNQFLCSNCTYFHKKNVNIIWKINIFYSLLYQGQLLILFFLLIDHESIWTYSICSASECRYFLFNLVLRQVKGRWFIVLYSSGTRLSKWVRWSNLIDLHNFCDDTVLTAQKKMSIERLDFKPLTSRMNSTINNIYYSLKLKTELQCQIAGSYLA